MIKAKDGIISIQKMLTKIGHQLLVLGFIILSSVGVGLAILGYEGAFTFTNHFDNPADCLNFCGPIHSFDVLAMLVGGTASIVGVIGAAAVVISGRTHQSKGPAHL